MHKRKLQRASIEKYKRMIQYGEEHLKSRARPRHERMSRDIGVSWMSDTCPYCQEFFKKDVFDTDDGPLEGECKQCPLRGEPYFSARCCDERWQRLANAATWREWVECAHDVMQYIKRHGMEVVK